MVAERVHSALGAIDVVSALLTYAGHRSKAFRGSQLYKVPNESLVAILVLMGYCKMSNTHLRGLAYLVDAYLLWRHLGPPGPAQFGPLFLTIWLAYLMATTEGV